MKLSNFVRQHWACVPCATGAHRSSPAWAYPLFILAGGAGPCLSDNAKRLDHRRSAGKPVGSRLIGQLFTDKDGNALPTVLPEQAICGGQRV